MSKLISCLPNHIPVMILNLILEGTEVEGLIGIEKCTGLKYEFFKNYPDNINKGLMKYKLVEEFQGKRRGGTIKYRFVTHN